MPVRFVLLKISVCTGAILGHKGARRTVAFMQKGEMFRFQMRTFRWIKDSIEIRVGIQEWPVKHGHNSQCCLGLVWLGLVGFSVNLPFPCAEKQTWQRFC